MPPTDNHQPGYAHKASVGKGFLDSSCNSMVSIPFEDLKMIELVINMIENILSRNENFGKKDIWRSL